MLSQLHQAPNHECDCSDAEEQDWLGGLPVHNLADRNDRLGDGVLVDEEVGLHAAELPDSEERQEAGGRLPQTDWRHELAGEDRVDTPVDELVEIHEDWLPDG